MVVVNAKSRADAVKKIKRWAKPHTAKIRSLRKIKSGQNKGKYEARVDI